MKHPAESDAELTFRLLASVPGAHAPAAIDPKVLFEKARHARRVQVEARMARIATMGQAAAVVVVLTVMIALLLTIPVSAK
jgi:hypothetical protein